MSDETIAPVTVLGVVCAHRGDSYGSRTWAGSTAAGLSLLVVADCGRWALSVFRHTELLVHVLAALGAEVDVIRAEEQRLAERRRVRESRVESLREYLRTNMDASGIAKIATGTHTITVADGAARVIIEDEGAVPAEYTRTRVEIDKRAILAAMKSDGECVPGTRVERSRALRIR